MKKAQVLLSLGSNIGERQRQILHATARIASVEGLELQALSDLVETEPVGPRQPPYINAAALVSCQLPPRQLLAICQQLELEAGRKRDVRWRPERLDIDIVLFGQRRIYSVSLVVPHPRFRQRAFVLDVAAQVAAEFRDPVTGKTVRELCEDLRKWK
ncbi:MAG: 2-amino-4-hydroxy-6-hydroxymethyldihydropteridine diphosphokinase [Planctomycetota bacterium]|nr:2-amino-4-hydroxy-6-hydroxymethyldihydropteridine diphosphokinase [Planctomycetota bacterium]